MNWKQTLRKYNKLDVETQNEAETKIIKAFKLMWDSNPTESEFDDYVSGLVLQARMIHYMITQR